jgi:outer membrane protein OmpA-like peptidoglycan-associated protein
LIIGSVCWAQDADIRGRVVDFVTKRGVDGATIELVFSGSPERSTVADSDGSFAFLKVPVRSLHEIRVSQLGYRPNPLTRPLTGQLANPFELRLLPEHADAEYLRRVAREIATVPEQSDELLGVVAAAGLSGAQHAIISGELNSIISSQGQSSVDRRLVLAAATERKEYDSARYKDAAIAAQAAENAQAERADAQRGAAQADAQRAAAAAAQAAAAEQTQLRAQLKEQLNTILQTRDTARGLVVAVSDVLFDSGKSTLTPGAREKLAKISGILLAHPGLRIRLEGHTDSIGSDDYNMALSKGRATAVANYFVSQGVPAGSLSAIGMGREGSVASNETASGRQLNRRVELVISGDAIGVPARFER